MRDFQYSQACFYFAKGDRNRELALFPRQKVASRRAHLRQKYLQGLFWIDGVGEVSVSAAPGTATSSTGTSAASSMRLFQASALANQVFQVSGSGTLAHDSRINQ
jgi:hypothetical protein